LGINLRKKKNAPGDGQLKRSAGRVVSAVQGKEKRGPRKGEERGRKKDAILTKLVRAYVRRKNWWAKRKMRLRLHGGYYKQRKT